MPKLLLKFNAAVIKEVPLNEGDTLTVGRKPENDVVIDNPAVSSHHCKISRQGDTFYVEDLGSTNGTFVNEKKIVKAGLHHQDVVGVAKHALVYIEDDPEKLKAAKSSSPDATVVLTPEKSQEMASAAAAISKSAQAERTGMLKVLKGAVGAAECELKGISTYIGKSDRAQVRILGSGFFGRAPDMACSIHRKPEGYVLMAIEDGYPKVNGAKVSGQKVLKDGDMIECGGTTMQFVLK